MNSDVPTSDQHDSDLRMVRECVDKLGEHFDSVQIFCTRHESGQEGGTINIPLGTGNWFARYGQIRNWINKEEESSREEIRRENDDG